MAALEILTTTLYEKAKYILYRGFRLTTFGLINDGGVINTIVDTQIYGTWLSVLETIITARCLKLFTSIGGPIGIILGGIFGIINILIYFGLFVGGSHVGAKGYSFAGNSLDNAISKNSDLLGDIEGYMYIFKMPFALSMALLSCSLQMLRDMATAWRNAAVRDKIYEENIHHITVYDTINHSTATSYSKKIKGALKLVPFLIGTTFFGLLMRLIVIPYFGKRSKFVQIIPECWGFFYPLGVLYTIYSISGSQPAKIGEQLGFRIKIQYDQFRGPSRAVHRDKLMPMSDSYVQDVGHVLFEGPWQLSYMFFERYYAFNSKALYMILVTNILLMTSCVLTAPQKPCEIPYIRKSIGPSLKNINQ